VNFGLVAQCLNQLPPPCAPQIVSNKRNVLYYTEYSRITLKGLLCVTEILNPLTPNDPYSGRAAPLTSKRCILYIYSTNIGNEYFKHGIYSPSFSSSKCNLFHDFNVFRSCIIHILYTDALKFKKNSGAKMLTKQLHIRRVHTRRFITGDINGFDSSR